MLFIIVKWKVSCFCLVHFSSGIVDGRKKSWLKERRGGEAMTGEHGKNTNTCKEVLTIQQKYQQKMAEDERERWKRRAQNYR